MNMWRDPYRQSLKELMSVKRKIVKIKFLEMDEKENDMLALVKRNRETLKCLSLCSKHVDLNKMMDIWSYAEFLESLVLYAFKSFKSTYDGDILSLRKLKVLRILLSEETCDIVKYISAPNVESLSLWGRWNADGLKPFFSHQTKLQKVCIGGRSLTVSELFQEDISGGSFQLQKLEISASKEEKFLSTEVEKNFIKFLQSHGQVLEELVLDCTLTAKIFKFIITNMQRLVKVFVLVNTVPLQFEFYEHFHPSPSLKELLLVSHRHETAMVKEIVETLYRVDQWKTVVKKYYDICRYCYYVVNEENTLKLVANTEFLLLCPAAIVLAIAIS